MLLEAKQLTKNFGSHVAVNGLDLQIPRGSFTALLGPNGAGKSTTLNMLIGLSTPTSGQLTYETPIKIGVVFQTSLLDSRLTVHENLMIRARQYRGVQPKRVALVSQQLGLTAFETQHYGTLSGGQKRRVDIARALLNDPDILFLDEPTTGLDIQTRTAIWQLLHELRRRRQLTVVLTTHYLDEADSADNVYIIDHGKCMATGTATAIKNRYAADVLEVTTPEPQRLKTAVSPVETAGERVTFRLRSAQEALTILSANQAIITNFEFRPGTMDDAFMTLTGKAVR